MNIFVWFGKVFPDSVLEAVDCPACSTRDEHWWTEEYCLPVEEGLTDAIGWQGDGVGGHTCQRRCGWSAVDGRSRGEGEAFCGAGRFCI